MKVKELIYRLRKLNGNAIVLHAFSEIRVPATIYEEIDSVEVNSKGDLVVLWCDDGEGIRIKELKNNSRKEVDGE